MRVDDPTESRLDVTPVAVFGLLWVALAIAAFVLSLRARRRVDESDGPIASLQSRPSAVETQLRARTVAQSQPTVSAVVVLLVLIRRLLAKGESSGHTDCHALGPNLQDSEALAPPRGSHRVTGCSAG